MFLVDYDYLLFIVFGNLLLCFVCYFDIFWVFIYFVYMYISMIILIKELDLIYILVNWRYVFIKYIIF